jgi:hypothetical protein
MTPIAANQIPSIREESVEESPDPHKILKHSDKKVYLGSPESAEEESPQNEDEGPGSDDDQPEEAEGEDDAQSEQIPLLFVDVNLGEGTTGELFGQI